PGHADRVAVPFQLDPVHPGKHRVVLDEKNPYLARVLHAPPLSSLLSPHGHSRTARPGRMMPQPVAHEPFSNVLRRSSSRSRSTASRCSRRRPVTVWASGAGVHLAHLARHPSPLQSPIVSQARTPLTPVISPTSR